MRFLFLLFIVFPAIEIGIFLFSGKLIGILPTVLLMILTGIIGAAAAKKQGTEVYHKVQRDLQYGKMPGETIVDGLCIFIGGLLLMLPGFLSDLAGACLLIPFTRSWWKPILFKWLRGMSKNKRIIIK
ncbi:FxsA family protein [Bacillus vallismortis]|uniref:Membrane protein FxsA n=1 Tax=Bacillus vallismortis TaxID=72361 RepID=A0AAP3FV67_BACVA|nr:FxsA family protein [Bacillus vallismortis]MBG9768975.1 exlusion protein FxsA [Bacillus vallismortis]MCI3985188.1 membrane protein FxsA [Bacillus vallismortis]MCI4137829.1 membrane protein FxsA [Bacillus vallismortis]MCY7893377.1 membrane protein FxsA [Bacillus vallismortis]MCY8308697.1 membrane protein FxsA [Bacillus vallismortis]